MNLKDACKRYNLDCETMSYYASRGVLDKSLCKDANVSDAALSQIGLIVLLERAQLCREDIALCLSDNIKGATKRKILRNARSKLLDDVHDKQKIIDKIDYLITEIKL